MYTALNLANYMIGRGTVEDLTPLKLQKMLYFVYGLYWKQNKKQLFNESFYAWDYGPVVKTVYDQFKSYKSNTITSPSEPDWESKINDADKESLNKLIDEVGGLKATELVSMSHLTEPWQEAYRDILNNEMPLVGIQRYFETVAT